MNERDTLDNMRREDNLVYIRAIKASVSSYINETTDRPKVKTAKNLISVLLDVLDDYERGDGEAAMRKIKLLWKEVNENE